MTCSKCHVEEYKARRQNCKSKLFSVVYRVILIKENCVVHSRVSLTVIYSFPEVRIREETGLVVLTKSKPSEDQKNGRLQIFFC